jgi:hypothetical protein
MTQESCGTKALNERLNRLWWMVMMLIAKLDAEKMKESNLEGDRL